MEEENVGRKPGWLSLVLLLLVTLGGAGLVAFLIHGDMDIYQTISKPSFAPPDWLFPVVWSVLYIMMAVSAWLVLRTDSPRKIKLLMLYIAQWLVNLVWPILFFTQRAWGLSFIWLLLLEALVIILMVSAFKISKAAGWLLVPYAAWVAFAGMLNCFIALWNP